MPQMFPLNWIILYILFSLIFLFFNILNYYANISLIKNKNSLKMFFHKNNLNWKW